MSYSSSSLLTGSSFASKLGIGRSFIQEAMNKQRIKEVTLALLVIVACGFAAAESDDFTKFVVTKLVALFLFGLACIEGKGLWKQNETTNAKRVLIKMSDFAIIPETRSLSETLAKTSGKDIETDLTGAEKSAAVREISKTVSQVGSRVLTVDVIESTRPRKRKVTRLRVSEGALENIVKEQDKPIQFALF